MSIHFAQNFSFRDANLEFHNAIQLIHEVVLKVVPTAYPVDPHAQFHMQSLMTCYNISGELEDDGDMRNVNIQESEGSRNVAAPEIPTDPMSQPLKIQKVNIGTEENLKFASVGDNWDDKIMAQIIDLLHEFQDLFSTRFSEMKGILGDLGEMKIPLKLDMKPVRQRPYWLKP